MDVVLVAAAEDDVGAASGHVGRYRDGAFLAGVRDDDGLAPGVLGVEGLVRDPPLPHQAVELLARLDRRGAHEHRLSFRVTSLDLVHHGPELVPLGEEDVVLPVLTDHGPVGGDGDDRRAVGLPELGVGALGRARHARELVVEAEVVLQRDRRDGHGLVEHLHALLGLDGLVEALRVPAPLEYATRELVDYLDLSL